MSATDTTRLWSFYTERQRWGLLAILFLVSTSNYLDRHIIAVLLEPIKREFQVSDMLLGLLSGFCFALFYAVAGMPIARWADRGNRRTIIALALTTWSIMTVLCVFAQTFWQLALTRALSDALSAVYGGAGLRYSLMTMMTVLIVSGAVCYGLGRTIPRDLEE